MAAEKTIEGFQLTFGKLKAISKKTEKPFWKLTEALDEMDLDLIDVAVQECMEKTPEESDAFLSQPGNIVLVKKELTEALVAFVTVAKAAEDLDAEKKS